MSADISNWADQIRAGDFRAISRAITAIEDNTPEAEDLVRRIFAHTGQSFVVGVTGAPGTGKSTLVDRLAETMEKRQNELDRVYGSGAWGMVRPGDAELHGMIRKFYESAMSKA